MTQRAGWRRVTFGEMAEQINERVDDPKKAGASIYVGLEHLDSDSLKIRRWGSPDDVEATKLRFYKGDIIFGRRRAYQRKLGVAEFDGICSAHAMVLRARPEVVVPEFLPFFMQSDVFMKRAQEISVGSLSPTINWTMLREQPFDLPPLHRQQKIVHLSRSIVGAVEAADECECLMGAVRESVVRSFLADDSSSCETPFGRIPANWKYLELSRFVESSAYGPRFSSDAYVDRGNVQTIRTTDFSANGGLDLESPPYALLDASLIAEHRLLAGDLLLSRSGEYAGMVRVFRGGAGVYIPAAFIIRYRFTPDLVADFAYELFASSVGARVVRSLARGSAQPNIAGSSFLNLRVPVPPISEQLTIVARLQGLRSSAIQIARRKSYLQDLFRELQSSTFGTR